MITDKEIRRFWNKWDLIIVSWNFVSFFFVLSVLSFFAGIALWIFDIDWWIFKSDWAVWFYIYGLTVPINIFLKYGLGIKGLWLFNDTVDGDFGDPKELEKAGRLNKSKFSNVIWWWFRNHSWGYITKFKPTCNASKSQISEHRVLFNTNGDYTPVWLKEEGSFHLCYRCKETGIVYCRYSKIDKNWERHFGAGGDRYKLHFKK